MSKERVIDERALQAAREKWYKKRPGPTKPTKSMHPFRWWLKKFEQKGNSFQEVAGSVGCTRENIRQLYKRYFAPLFPGFSSGRSRQRFRTLEQWAVKARNFSGAPEKLREIAEIARRRGFTAEKISTSSEREPVYLSSCSLLINGKRCDIHQGRNIWAFPLGKRMYTRFHVSVDRLRKHDFLIVLQEAKAYSKKVFVVPVPILRRWGKRKKQIFLYIPLKRYPIYRNKTPRIDIWQYLDAWHLLRNP